MCRRGLALLALLATPAWGCAGRTLGLSACDDGLLDRGEVCLQAASALRRADFEPLAMRVADFDGDGHLDVLMLGVVDWTIESVLLPGDGTGRLVDEKDPRVYGCSAYPIPGDLDGDAAVDLLVDECGPSMLVFSGGTDGFGEGRSVATGTTTRTSSIFDVDGDGHSDIVVLGADEGGPATLNVVSADGQGDYRPPAASAVAAASSSFDPWGFGLGDIDEDGRTDVLFVDAAEGHDHFAVGKGRGDGTFEAPTIVPTELTPEGAWLRDFDGDDHLDVLVRDPAPPELVLLRGDGGGGFEPGARTRLEPGQLLSSTLADLDGDGNDDVLLGHSDRTTVEAWLGQGDGSFDGPNEIESDGAPDQIDTGDFDEDGALDLVVASFTDGGIRVILATP